MIEIFILSVVQGITEFLPISSSSHLIIMSNFINFEKQSLVIDVNLHIGSLIAVVTYFYKDIVGFVKNKQLLIKILVSSIPVIVVGFILVKANFIEKLRNIEVIGWTTLIFGVLLYISDKFKLEKNLNENFNYKTALIIGLFQILSLIPGVSRSGITITAGRFLGFKRFDASKISFLLSIPTLTAVSIYGLSAILTERNLEVLSLNYLSILFSFIFSYLTIKYFLNYISKFSMSLFVFYRLALGVILMSIIYL
ncbi:MAG: undecaprenyl-diphosphate phosphatase [Pseudomonadota bacterium]|nr:undecaprenyl-diphosphate phosphatase [Pseudomonadota bacterium]